LCVTSSSRLVIALPDEDSQCEEGIIRVRKKQTQRREGGEDAERKSEVSGSACDVVSGHFEQQVLDASAFEEAALHRGAAGAAADVAELAIPELRDIVHTRRDRCMRRATARLRGGGAQTSWCSRQYRASCSAQMDFPESRHSSYHWAEDCLLRADHVSLTVSFHERGSPQALAPRQQQQHPRTKPNAASREQPR